MMLNAQSKKMYCLVYGQMSHWGATVITNLLSAIPFIGQDIVPFIWGGFENMDPNYNTKISPLLGNKIILSSAGWITSHITGVNLFKIIFQTSPASPGGFLPPLGGETNEFPSLCVGYLYKLNHGEFIWCIILIILLNAKKSSMPPYEEVAVLEPGANASGIIYLKSLYYITKYYVFNKYDNIWNKSFKVKIRDLRRQLAVIFYKKDQNDPLEVNTISNENIYNDLTHILSYNGGISPLEGNILDKFKINPVMKSPHQDIIKNEIDKPIKVIKRLNAKDLMNIYIMGLLEGDGWFSVSKKGKYLTYEIGIELHIRDIQLLYKIKKHLGVGIVGTRTRKGKNDKVLELAYYKIRDKKILKNIILPIFDKYNFYTNKHYDYMFLRDCLLKDIKYYHDLPLYSRPKDKPYLSYNDILNNEYFKYWLIGFIEAESNFSIYTLNNSKKPYRPDPILGSGQLPLRGYKIISFEITQTNEYEIIKAISIFFKITSNIYKDKTNKFSIKTTRKICLQNIIKYIKNSPIKLQGHKQIQYLNFIKEMKNYPTSSVSKPSKINRPIKL